jgi:hypothetical protein
VAAHHSPTDYNHSGAVHHAAKSEVSESKQVTLLSIWCGIDSDKNQWKLHHLLALHIPGCIRSVLINNSTQKHCFAETVPAKLASPLH